MELPQEHPHQSLHRPDGAPVGSPPSKRPTQAIVEVRAARKSDPRRASAAKPGAKAHKPISHTDSLGGHTHLSIPLLSSQAEYSISTMRDFFKKRPTRALLDCFRSQDLDQSGTVDQEEFCAVLTSLGLDKVLTKKDMVAAFETTDTDGSGSIEFTEFYNNFRTDKFKREDFFWGKVRPLTTLSREDRVKLAARLGEDDGCSRTTDEMLQIIQRKVDVKGLRQMFEAYDENRSGRIDTAEFQMAMKHVGIAINEYEAQDVITRINAEAGLPDFHTNLSYPEWARAFGEVRIGGEAAGPKAACIHPA